MTVTLAPAAAPPVLDLSARLAAVDAAMTVRLDEAGLAFDVNTAYLPAPPVEITVPLPLIPAAAPDPQATPIAGLLRRARARIVQDGWCRDAIYDETGAVCPIRAIRLEAPGNRRLADDACVLLLDVIQTELPDVQTIPSWNAAQTSDRPVLHALDRATQTASTRGI